MAVGLHSRIVAGVVLAAGVAIGADAQVPATAPSTAPAATAPAAAPARGGRGGRGGPAITVAPLPDAVAVDLAPPLDKAGNFKVAPHTTWNAVQGIQVEEGTPRGKVITFRMNSQDSKLFPGNGRPFTRDVWVYIPAGYKEGTELPLMVDHDGGARAVVQTQLIAAMDNLIAEKKLPMMAGVFIANGGQERSLEYDTVSGKYAEFIETEVLPLAEKTANVKFTKDPDARGVIGQSSGSAAALAMAWFHNDWYHRVISYSGSFTNLQRNNTYPQGAWNYQDSLIPKTDKKPIRIWMEVGSNDLNSTSPETAYNNWPLANNHMAEALKAKGYEYQFLWAQGAGHVEGGVERQTMAEAMEWVWKTYTAK